MNGSRYINWTREAHRLPFFIPLSKAIHYIMTPLQDFVIKALRLAEQQIRDNQCSEEELSSVARFFAERMNAWVSVQDLAKLYGKSENAVRTVISRRHIPERDKPQRKVFYRAGWFAKNAPRSWQ